MCCRREMEASLISFRAGPYIDFPFGDKFSARASAGLAGILVDSDFSFKETTTTLDGGPVTRSGKGSDSSFEVGGYISGSFHYKVHDNIGLFGGIQFQGLTSFEQKAGGKEASLDLGQTFLVQGGVSFSF